MFGKLLQYGMDKLPDQSNNPSVVTGVEWLDESATRRFGESWLVWLFVDKGLEVIDAGHQPGRDAPWPIQIDSSDAMVPKFWILQCVTSFSGDTRLGTCQGRSSSKTSKYRAWIRIKWTQRCFFLVSYYAFDLVTLFETLWLSNMSYVLATKWAID